MTSMVALSSKGCFSSMVVFHVRIEGLCEKRRLFVRYVFCSPGCLSLNHAPVALSMEQASSWREREREREKLWFNMSSFCQATVYVRLPLKEDEGLSWVGLNLLQLRGIISEVA